MKTEKSDRAPCYKPLEQIVVRVPLLPIEFYLKLAAENHADYAGLDDKIKYAVMVGSQTLSASLERKPAKEKDRQKDQSKLLRYLIRMSSRCTPYGLFAGVAMATTGDETNISLSDVHLQTCTRPDMDWLLRFVNKMEQREEVLRHLHISANPTVFLCGERLYLQERLSAGKADVEPRVSIRATRIVKRVLELVKSPIAYNTLMEELLEENKSAGKEKIEKLLKELLEQTILITNLRPPLTTANPAEHMLSVLGQNPAAAEQKEKLQTFLGMVKECDCGSFSERISKFPKLKIYADEITGPSTNPVVQVDACRTLAGSVISKQVAGEVSRAAETMLLLSPYPTGYYPLGTYLNAFVTKYGQDRKVPIMEMLDPNFGLGIPKEYSGGDGGTGNRANATVRNQLLLKLATEAIRDKKTVVTLDDDIINQLKTWPGKEGKAPVSMDICAFVSAKSASDIDAGNFQIVIGPNLGAASAGKMLGRFAHIAGEKAYGVLSQIADIEKRHAPDKLFAELVYLPRKYRSGNVAVRPAIQSHEIVLGVAPGVAPDKVIPVNELLVGVKDRHLCLYWKDNTEIYIASGHMLNSYGAPAICRFLSDAGKPLQTGFTNFDWGPASNFQFLPRVQFGRIALSTAEWRISEITFTKEVLDSSPRFAEEFKTWQNAWNAPRYLYIANGDNRLLVDTQSPTHVEELRAEIKHVRHILLQEAYPGPEHAWLPGPDGHYLMEIAVSLVTSDIPEIEDKKEVKITPAKAEPGFLKNIFKRSETNPVRVRPPGSDWLFIKLYCGQELEEDLLLECKNFTESVLAKKYADDSFFIRYSDPDPHIRLRFQGNPKRLTDKLYPLVCSWATDLQAKNLCLKFVFDTYERETERYGGPNAIYLAEKLFASDSEAVFDLLAAERTKHDKQDRIITAVASMHNLLADMGLDIKAQIDWCEKHVNSWNKVSKEYREKQKQLREALSDTGKALGPDIVEIFSRRHKKLEQVSGEYCALEQTGRLNPEYRDILRSIVHMHCNRFLGSNADEHKALGLLFRTLKSLAAIKPAAK
jgi:thiopeptide-type bacteriocin biosynthesis protein